MCTLSSWFFQGDDERKCPIRCCQWALFSHLSVEETDATRYKEMGKSNVIYQDVIMSHSAVLTMAYVKFIAYFTGRYSPLKDIGGWASLLILRKE